MLTIIIAVASCAALCLCISVCIYVRRNKKTVEALQDVLVEVMTTKKAERWSEERMSGGSKVTFAPGLQLDTKRRCSTKHVDAKLTRSLSNKAVRKAIKTAEVMNAEAGESDVDTPNPDPLSAASSPGFDAPGRYTSRRGRDSFAEDLTMEAATKSEHPSGRMTTRAAAVRFAANLRPRDGGDESRRGLPTPSSLPRPGAVGSGRLDYNHGLQDLDSRPASFEASPLDSAFRRSSVAKFFSSDEDGGAGAGFRLGLSPRAAPSCVPVEAEPARPALMRRTSSIKITKQSLAILSDEEQQVFKKAMEKLGTVEGDFLDVDATFLEPALSPQMEATAEKAKEPDLEAASITSASDRTAAALSKLRSARSVQLEAEAPATQPRSFESLSRSLNRGPPAAQTATLAGPSMMLLDGDFAQPSFRDVEKPKLDVTPVDETPDAGQDEPSALELAREARSQPPPAPRARSLSASRVDAPPPSTPKRFKARPNELEPRAPNLELTPAATPAPKPARVKFEPPTPPADGANTSTCGAPFGAKLKRPQGVQRRQLTGLERAGSQKNLASSATRLTSEPGSSDVAAQAAGDSPGKLVQYF